MAARKHITVRHEDILRLEGALQSLREEEDPTKRPKVLTHDFVASKLGIRSSTVRNWVRLARPIARRSENAAAFLNVYDAIGAALGERLVGALFDTATQASGRDQFRAATWLLSRVDPAAFDEAAAEQTEEDDGLDIASQPQEVYDKLTAAELTRLEELVAVRESAREEALDIFLKAKQRVLNETIEAKNVH